MVTLRCQDCGKTYEGKKTDIENKECDCGGSYEVKGSDEDSYEPNQCDQCKKDIANSDSYSCDECGDSNLCESCIITKLESVSVCKSCVDKAYPREGKTIEKEVIKYVEVPKEKIVVMGFSEPIL